MPDGVADDEVEDLVEVQARLDRLADLPQGLELLDLGRELGPARLEDLHELDLAQDDRGLQRELLQELLVVQVEVGDPGVEHREGADHLVLEDQRSGQERAVAGDPL